MTEPQKDWPVALWAIYDRRSGDFLPSLRDPILDKNHSALRYLPESALLSDEVIEAIKARWFDASSEGDDTYVARALVEAAIKAASEQ